MKLQRASFDKAWLESLNTESVERWRRLSMIGCPSMMDSKISHTSVRLLFDHLLCALNRLRDSALDELTDDEWLEEFRQPFPSADRTHAI